MTKGETIGVSDYEILKNSNSDKATELKKELYKLTMEIIDEDDE